MDGSQLLFAGWFEGIDHPVAGAQVMSRNTAFEVQCERNFSHHHVQYHIQF